MCKCPGGQGLQRSPICIVLSVECCYYIKAMYHGALIIFLTIHSMVNSNLVYSNRFCTPIYKINYRYLEKY